MLTIDPRILEPLPTELRGVACASCDRLGASWKLSLPGSVIPTLCSLCLLYETPWGQRNRSELDTLLERIFTQEKVLFERDEVGKLLRCGDGDRIVFSALAVSKAVALHRRLRASPS